MAYKYNLENKKVGKLLVKKLVPIEKRPTKTHGNYWYCDCDCGTKDIMVPTSYLTGNGNYTQKSCGCDRKLKAFISTTDKRIVSEDFVSQFNNLEKYLFIHKALIQTNKKNISQYTKEEYEELINHFYSQKEFNALYNFWQTQERLNTFYDLAKPSLDHKDPYSRSQNNKIENLQFLTLFENLAKRDMTWEEWQNFKKITHSTSDYYIENVLNWYERRENIG